jgi:hypothetical protein
MQSLPAAEPGTVLRIVATNDMGAALIPMPTSYGTGGTCAGITALLDRECHRQPTIWLDSGDLTVGAVRSLLGAPPWADIAELPIAAAAAGNHEFDDGVPALLEGAQSLPFPVLCANADVGLLATTMVESEPGAVGVIGLTHPHLDRFGDAPRLPDDWPKRIHPLADDLRSQGADWVIALLHDGVDWWPNHNSNGCPISTRAERLNSVAEPWAKEVDLILGAHTLGAWVGELAGTPAGHAFPFASSALVVDLPKPPGRPIVRGFFLVPPVRSNRATPAIDALESAAESVIGDSSETWVTKTGVDRYLPHFVADVERRATGADAAFVPGQHSTQAPLDGVLAALLAGPVTELDLHRLFNYVDDHLVIVELRSGEFRAAVDSYNATFDPQSHEGDYEAWNSCRMPAGVSVAVDDPRLVAVMHWVAPRLSAWVGRELVGEPTNVGGREAMIQLIR